jgi:DNA polymerase-3 subunit epsilon
LRRRQNQVLLAIDASGGAATPPAADFDLAQLGACYGPFGSRTSVRRFLAALAGEHGLCLKTIGIEGRRRAIDDGAPCFSRQLGKCRGACVGVEPREEHANRLREALAPWLLPAWPRSGAIALVERNAERFREDWHVFDRWCWLGTVHSIDAALELAGSAERRFEADAARLAVQALSDEPPWPVELVELRAGLIAAESAVSELAG